MYRSHLSLLMLCRFHRKDLIEFFQKSLVITVISWTRNSVPERVKQILRSEELHFGGPYAK